MQVELRQEDFVASYGVEEVNASREATGRSWG